MTALKQQGRALSELLQGLTILSDEQDCLINGLELDSRRLKPGDCFIAIQGINDHGADYIPAAFEAGAVAVLADSTDQDRVKTSSGNVIFIDQLRDQYGVIAHRFYGMPSSSMQVFGVTGTNGKTTVTHFIAQALDHLYKSERDNREHPEQDLPRQQSSSVVGTLCNGLLDQPAVADMTTPHAVSLHHMLAGFLQQGAVSVAIEASSHGLEQCRLGGIEFDVAVFTNLTRDHLDYHGDMQSYGAAKMKLFQNPNLKAAVLNLDDSFATQIQQMIPDGVEILGYSLDPKKQVDDIAIMTCLKLDITMQGLKMYVQTPYGSGTLMTNVLGRFNASNLLAALGALLTSGVDLQQALDALSRVSGVKGRMELFSQGEKTVVVDYAHTPDGLARALETLREVCTGSLWCVFGCGGDRDKGKRPQMAAAAEEWADRLIITSDNPRSEAPSLIADDMLAGMQKPDISQVILERREAIEEAIRSAAKDDIVLVAGKGHEQWQEIKGQRFPFDDRNIVLGLLAEYITGGNT